MNFLEIDLSADFAQLKNATLGSLVRDKLLLKILNGELVPGQPLREPEIVEELQVSRVPVREALRQLESMGLVVSKKNSGVSVRTLTDKEVEDLYAFRAVLDGFAGLQICQRNKTEREKISDNLIEICHQMRLAIEENNTQKYYKLNLQFHWIFIESLGNDEIKKTYREIMQKLHLARFKNLKSVEHRKKSNEEHIIISNALRDADSADAIQACAEYLREHVSHALLRLKEL